MKILIDMNLSPKWRQVFCEAGWEAFHWSDIGAYDAMDAEILDWAKHNDCLVFTHDLDFGAILAATKAEAPSVVQIRTQNLSPTIAAARLIAVIREYQDTLKQGALLTIDEPRARIRLLPFE